MSTPLIAICADFKSMNLTDLGRICWSSRSMITPFLQQIATKLAVKESFFLQSCNRREFYLVMGEPRTPDFVSRFLEELDTSLGVALTACQFQVFEQDEASLRLFRVASSLESMVLGETEIMKQIKDQFSDSQACGNSGRVLRTLVDNALRAAKRVRSETGITRHVTSMASLIHRAVGTFLGCRQGRIVFVGAGHFMESLVPPFSKLQNGSFVFVNRTLPTELAGRFGGEARTLSSFINDPGPFDVLISATSAAHTLFSTEWIKDHTGDMTMLVDGALPHDIDPACAQLAGVRYFGLEQLEEQLAKNRILRAAEIPKAEPIFEEELALLNEQWRELGLNRLHAGMAAYYQETAQRALASLLRQTEGLTECQRLALAVYSQNLVQRLVAVPVLGLRGVARELGEEGVSAWLKGVSSGSPLFQECVSG